MIAKHNPSAHFSTWFHVEILSYALKICSRQNNLHLSHSIYLLPYSKPSSEQRFAQCLSRIMLHEA